MASIKKAKKRRMPVPGRKCQICKDQIYKIEEYDEHIGWFSIFDARNTCDKTECQDKWKKRSKTFNEGD